ncbi:MAG: hypothetical protein K0Q72_990 [Armatimonadetes bacterium]|nr:hypothetical protein [Armatimonadota bacterium]
MQTDRTTKTLLFFIAVALWGMLIKGFFEPTPTVAQAVRSPVASGPMLTPVRIVAVDGGSLPVSITRQASPLEVKTVAGSKFKVELEK